MRQTRAALAKKRAALAKKRLSLAADQQRRFLLHLHLRRLGLPAEVVFLIVWHVIGGTGTSVFSPIVVD